MCVSGYDTSHIVHISDLTFFSRSQRSKLKISLPSDMFRCYLEERAIIRFDGVPIGTHYVYAKFWPDWAPNMATGGHW